MTQFLDRAAERELEIRGDALAEQRRRAGLEGKTADDSAKECEQCDEPIPQARREAYPGTQLCANCKRLEELRDKKWR